MSAVYVLIMHVNIVGPFEQNISALSGFKELEDCIATSLANEKHFCFYLLYAL